MDFTLMLQSVSSLGVDQLRELNKEVVERMRYRDRIKQQSAARAIRVGDLMRFNSKYGSIKTIRVEKINTKTVSGTEIQDGTVTRNQWRVSPSMLFA